MCLNIKAYLCLLLTIALTHTATHAFADTIAQNPANNTQTPGKTAAAAEQPGLQATSLQASPLNTYQQALNYLLGRNGTQKSAEKAASLFKTLAEQNWSSAQHMLGNMYLRGKGVEKNELLAYKWLSLASKNNMQLAQAIHSKRKQLYQSLQNNLSLQSLNQVETWIAEWKPSITTTTAQLN